jgi:hypothetical protein
VAKEGKRLLVHLELAGADVKRLQAIAPPLLAAFEKISNSNYLQAYHSPARDTLGYLLRTDLAAPQVRARLKEAPVGRDRRGDVLMPILGPADKVLVLEIGEEHDAREFRAKIEPWLSHH